jgi:putative FmdB family regulatory protein
MPLYEYRCDDCGDIFEVIQKFSDEPLSVHEGCGGKVVRVLSAPALQFKGTGWYVTDYAGNGGAKQDGKPDSKQDSKQDKKTDSTESKSESKKSDSDTSKPKAPAEK